MATEGDSRCMENRGLLTADDRAFFEGDKDTDDPNKVAREKRYNVRERIENIAEDLEILRAAGEDELVAKFYDETGRHTRLAEKIEQLESELDE